MWAPVRASLQRYLAGTRPSSASRSASSPDPATRRRPDYPVLGGQWRVRSPRFARPGATRGASRLDDHAQPDDDALEGYLGLEGETHMSWSKQLGLVGTGTAVILTVAISGIGSASAAQTGKLTGSASTTYVVKQLGHLADGRPLLTSTTPTGLPPSAIKRVYNLSGLSPSSGAGAGQVIAIVDAFHDPHALSDLNTFNKRYGYATLSTCTSLSQSGSCFEQREPASGTPKVNSGWVLEESLDIEWAHAEAPAAKIVLVEAKTNSNTNLFNAVTFANSLGATEVSMSWGGGESTSETSLDADFTHAGTFYTASSGDSGHGTEYPAASPNVIAVGGTTLNGCGGTSCSFASETAWSGSGGGISAVESLPGYQSSYTGPVSGASSISALTGVKRGI